MRSCGPAMRRTAGASVVAWLSDNSERLYESDNCVLRQPHRSATDGLSGASETEMTQRRIDSLSVMYKKSSDRGDIPTASRQSDRWRPAARAPESLASECQLASAPARGQLR